MRSGMGIPAAALCVGLLLATACSIIENEGKIGVVEQVQQASLDETYQATLKALGDLEFDVTRSDVDKLTGYVEGTTADQKRFEIILEKLTDEATNVRIHFEPMGDKPRSALVQQEIAKNL
ncbi:MAG TPA: DUF3568 family protein [Candidatus Sumerlaeota bacterium]|nr:DUF3568 family protein [Candidatus Sumerlaeota bacterium]HPK02194.1 DUF3568 family protein [Candidatus Sumerlaeota bacterium]